MHFQVCYFCYKLYSKCGSIYKLKFSFIDYNCTNYPIYSNYKILILICYKECIICHKHIYLLDFEYLSEMEQSMKHKLKTHFDILKQYEKIKRFLRKIQITKNLIKFSLMKNYKHFSASENLSHGHSYRY